jgi:sulfite exporter TauE/SafE
MSADLQALLLTAIAISFLHTLAGPDHYLPFIALSKSRRWSLARTLFWTLVCGSGHVLGSVLLGLGGAALGWSVSKIDGLEQTRGHLAGWMLLGFGALYAIWGFVRARRNGLHKHFDVPGRRRRLRVRTQAWRSGAAPGPSCGYALGAVPDLCIRALRTHDSPALFSGCKTFRRRHAAPDSGLYRVYIGLHGGDGCAWVLRYPF